MKRYLTRPNWVNIAFTLAGLVLMAVAALDFFMPLMGESGILLAPMIAVADLRQKRKKVLEEARKILEEAGDKPLTEEQQAAFDEKFDTGEELRKRIATQEQLDGAMDGLDEPGEVRSVEVDDDAETRGGITRVGDDLGSQAHWRRRAVRYFRAIVMKKESEERARSMIDELKATTAELSERQRRDELSEAYDIIDRAGKLNESRKFMMKQLLADEQRLLSTESGAAQGGDHLLPQPFLAQIYVLLENFGVARRLFRVVPFSGAGNTVDLYKVVQKVTAYWVAQGANITASDVEFGEDQLAFYKAAAITAFTAETDEDLQVQFLPELQRQIAEKIAELEDDAGINGDGTSTYGNFTGVFNLSGATVTKTGGTNLASITEAKLREAKQSVPMHQRGNASWLMHESILDEIRQFENGAGYRIFSEDASQEGSGRLLGYPVVTSTKCVDSSSISGNDTPLLSFGDHSRMIMMIKRGMTADISREAILQDGEGAITYNAYQGDGALLRVTERVGFACPTPWQAAIAVLETAAAG